MSPRSAWSCGLSAKVNRPIRTIPAHSQTSDSPASEEDDEPDRAAEVDADDQRLAPDPVRQPAGDDRHRDREDDQHAVHQPVGGRVEAEDLGQVEEHEQVHDAEPSPAAAEHRREVEPAQVVVAEDAPERRADGAAGARRRPVRATLADEDQDRDGDRDRRQPERDRRAAPADRGDERHADEGDDDRARRCRRRCGR